MYSAKLVHPTLKIMRGEKYLAIQSSHKFALRALEVAGSIRVFLLRLHQLLAVEIPAAI